MKASIRAFLYRVELTDKHGRQKKHVAEVRADSNENARRAIIHTTMAEGGTVQLITPADNPQKLTGDSNRRRYG